MPVSSYRRNLPELIRSSDETYLRGLAAISRSTATRSSTRSTIDTSNEKKTEIENRYSLRYKSHSFTSNSLGLSRHSEDTLRKRRESGSSVVSSKSSTSTSSSLSPTRGTGTKLTATSKTNTTNGITNSRRKSSVHDASRESSSGENERVGSLTSSPKWSRIKETFESNKKPSANSDSECHIKSKLNRTHSHSTSSLPLISSTRAKSTERELALKKSSKVPTYCHSANLQNISSDIDEKTELIRINSSQRNGISKLPTLSTRLDLQSNSDRIRRCSDSSLLEKESGSSFTKDKSFTKGLNEKSVLKTEYTDDKCFYSSIGTKTNLCRARKLNGAGLSLSKSGELNLGVSKEASKCPVTTTKGTDSKFEPDSFEEKVKALRKRIASTAKEYDSILSGKTSINYETSNSLTRSSSFKQDYVSSRDISLRESSPIISQGEAKEFQKEFTQNSSLSKTCDNNALNHSSGVLCKVSTENKARAKDTEQLRITPGRSKSSLHSLTVDKEFEDVTVRCLPKSLDLSTFNSTSTANSKGWQKANNGAWMKVDIDKEVATSTTKSRVALLAQQFNNLQDTNLDDKSADIVLRPVSVSGLPCIKNKSRSTKHSESDIKYDSSPPKYQTTQAFKERCLSLPSSRDTSMSSLKNSSPASESSTEDIDGNKQMLHGSRKLSIVKQVVQSFEEQLASSNSSESGSSHENTPTSAGHCKNNPYNFNYKSPTNAHDKIKNSCTKVQSEPSLPQNLNSTAQNSKTSFNLIPHCIPDKCTKDSKRSIANEDKISKSQTSKLKIVSKHPSGKKPSIKRPDLPPPRQLVTPKKALYINAPSNEDSLLAELEEWLVQKYDRTDSTSSTSSVFPANAVPNQSFLWKDLGPKLSSSSQSDDGTRNSPKMDGGEQSALGNYYSLPFPHPSSPVKKCHEDHIYMEAAFVRQQDTKNTDNGSSCDSDEGWVDVSDTELEGNTDSLKNSHLNARLRVRTKSISSQAGSRKSWRESVRELAVAEASSSLLDTDDDTWNHKDYQDIMIWESIDGDDSSLSSTSDHFYEALYEEIVDNNYLKDVKADLLGKGLKSIDENPDVSPLSHNGATLNSATKYHNISGLKKQNSFTESCNEPPTENSTLLKRNWSLTKKDIHVELDSKLGKAKAQSAHNISENEVLNSKQSISPPAVPSVGASKRKTLIKFILRQKNGSTTSTTTLPASPVPISTHGNKKRTRKKGSMFYVRWSTVNRDTRQKSQSENDIAHENHSEVDSGNGTSSERLDSTSPTKVATIRRRVSGSIRRPSSPPPLPPITGATVVRTHSGTKSLEILRPPLSRIPREEKTKSLDSVAPIEVSTSNEESASNNLPEKLKRSGSNSERSSCSSTGTRTSSSSSSCVPVDSPFSLSPKCRSSVASSQSSHSGGGSYINVEDIASKPTSLSLPIGGTDNESLCSYLLINCGMKEPLRSPFEEEPLYQFYHKDAKQRATLWQSMSTTEEDESLYHEDFSDDFSDTESDDDKLKDTKNDKSPTSPGLGTLKTLFLPSSGSNIPSAMELLRQEGNGGQRTLWCEVPEVKNSGILEKISSQDRKIQEAMFEVITSEASYFKSLNILLEHFMQCPEFSDDFSVNCVLGRRERHILFSDVAPVRDVCARLLADLECRWQENIVLTNICDILYEHASKFFNVYVKYCANQVYQDRILKELKATRPDFIDVLQRLESNPICQGLDMLSFLMLPMQRITRMPLLVDAIYHRLSPNSQYHNICKLTLAMLNKVVSECNEGARRMERMEEMLVISRQLDFKDCKSIPLISASRWLVKKGELTRVTFDSSVSKRTFGRGSKFAKNFVYFFLFTDLLVVAKKKNEESFIVLDYCPRNMVQVFTLEESNVQLPGKLPDGLRNLFQLTMLQNNEFKTIEMILSCPLESDRTRWMEAVTPPISENPEEKIYEEWDCPQVQCIYPYFAQQPDELTLEESDVVNVLRKMPDGWYEGERLRDGLRGWFPASFSVEIISSHIRARNLRQRYRLLMLSQAYVEEQRKAFMNQAKMK